MQGVVAGSAHVEKGAGVVARANKSGRVGTPTTQGVVAGSARATEDARAGARATTSGRAGAPTFKDSKGDKVTSTPKAEASSRDADSAVGDKVPQVFDVFTGVPKVGEVLTPLPTVAELLELEELSYVEFMDSLKAGELAEVVLIRPEGSSLELNSSSVMDSEVLEDERTTKRQTRYGTAILKDPSDPYYALLKEFSDVVSDDPSSVLPPDRGVRHEIDLVPGTKYCTTRQWPLPKEQVDVIDTFFAAKHAAGMVRESKSPHSSPTFCVRKPNGKCRMVHAFNKLNAATIPASTPIPRKDVLQNNMAGCTIFSALDMVDGYYQLLMRESDIPLTAVSTPSGMLWEWLVMPQGLSNAPATFNRLVTQLFRPMRQFVQTYFDDIFVHSRASEGKTAVEAHLGHLREVLLCMRENRLYANINKCIFGAEEIPFLGCFLGKDGVRADPEKVCAIAQWPVPVSQKDLRKWLGLANYLHKYSANYAEMALPLTNLLKKDAVWSWTSEAQQAFEAIMSSLQSALILALPDEERPFSVVCDASDFAIGCALLQVDAEGRERVVSFQSRQLKAAEKNYPVHDKELLEMKYALVKFRVHLLGQKPFVIYTDHASLRTATSSPHLSQRMARWLSFFAECNFTVVYKPGKQNVLADALSRRPDYELAHLAYLESPLYELIREAYADDDDLAGLVEVLSAPNKAIELTARQRSRLHRYSVVEGLLYYQVDGGDEPRIVVPNDEDLRHRVLYEAHATPLSGHLGREKTYTSVARNFWWPHMYKSVRKYVQTCETCQRVKPAPSASAPLMSLPVPADCWRSVSMDFIFELPAYARGHTDILVFVCRLSKMVRLAAVRKSVTAPQAAQLFVDNVFRNHGHPEAFVSDRDPRFMSHFWQHLFRLLGTRLDMSTADHPQTDGQTERVNRVLEDILSSVCAAEPTKWSVLLPQVEFALNNAVHSSTGFTPFYVSGLRHPRTPLTLPPASSLGGGEANADDPRGLKGLRTSVKRNVLSFIKTGKAVRQRVRDAMAAAQDTQKEQSDRQGRKNTQVFKLGDQVLLNAKNLPTQTVFAVGSTKLRPRFVGPFTVIGVHGHAYTLDLPSSMATHPTFYVGLLKPYRPAGADEPEEPTASQNTAERHSPSSERDLPREAGQAQEPEPEPEPGQEHEPLRG
ncbi:Transposon Tf2-9 polyprotein [Phytophthora fragariae]|uniref:Transposon Tf2-9 polyprotein n=2 Tax=Phytophthora fragariae TaxID=53985 RepID=A0A6G0JT22_9STRA|nr:Transposon Tf2-9 polyprotein [Phytophthora fragariae]